MLSLTTATIAPARADTTDCSAGWVALTYDDGPIKVRTDTVLAALNSAGVQATFFVVGMFARANPDILRATADLGNVVANHTDLHETLTSLSEIAIVQTLDKTDAAIRAAGVEPGRLVRPPGGNTNGRVEDVIETAGYLQILWDVDPQDWSGISAGGIHSNVVGHAGDGSVILLHDANANYRNTATATTMIISTLHSRGFCFGVINNDGDIVPADEAAQLIGPFYDIGNSVFIDDILWLFDEGITKGCNPPYNNRYCPDNSVTRGQMAAFLVRTLGLSDGAGSNAFTDDDDSIFEADIERLAEAGITKGCNPPDNSKFCPDRRISREEIAAFLARAFDLDEADTLNAFTDVGDSMFGIEIASLAAAGVTKGCNPPDNTLFCPNETVTRGQMAAFLHRAQPFAPS
jgi:peptidoglycan/xylan/chitin deacetylase (PgdA/CDA1 family)